MLKLLLDFDKISKNGRNIYEWNEINPILLDIFFLRTFLNESGKWTSWRFGISISINIQYCKLLSNVIKQGQKKVSPPELMMVLSLGRSRFNHSTRFHSYFASSSNLIFLPFLQEHPHRVEEVAVNKDLDSIISFICIRYHLLLSKMIQKTHNHQVQ